MNMSADVVTLSVVAVLVTSFLVSWLLVLTQRWHGGRSLDHDLTGAQKIHHCPVPRIGGVGLISGIAVGAWLSFEQGSDAWLYVLKLALCATPVFVAGLIEDLTKQVTVKVRLLASFLAAGLGVWAMDASLLRLDTPLLDELMVWSPAAILFTCFAVGGLTNAVNIIDGLNGLASGAVTLMLAGLATIAWYVGDVTVMNLCLFGIAALAGFMILNYPFGRIFLGDGGAYLAGFWLAECAVLLLHRNPSVSTWAVLLCVMYPAWETAFSMYRRHFIQRTSSGTPDMAHFHHLVFKAIRRKLGVQSAIWQSHGFSSALVWMLVASCQAGAFVATRAHSTAMVLALVFACAYVWIYSRLDARQSLYSRANGFEPQNSHPI
jgi:UDP-N-acetylmuramyl pentapeptide phosphotransferase/UDP-N-acetylglucosamine-1-phosphate transferase